MNDSTPTTRQKALAINLDASTYGTFAEIGGGQEVARWFFSVGGAAGTVAKTISAYDMAVSDSLYGPAKRYVSRQRLEAMLDQEFAQLLDRLGSARGDAKRFFAFADTVATRSYGQPGQRTRLARRPIPVPAARASRRASSFTLTCSNPTAARQQEALGVLGVNLIHGAFMHHASIAELIASLMDELVARADRGRYDEAHRLGVHGPGQPAGELATGGARTDRCRDVHRNRRGRAAIGGSLQEADPRRARQLPTRDEAHARLAQPGIRAILAGAERPRTEARGAG